MHSFGLGDLLPGVTCTPSGGEIYITIYTHNFLYTLETISELLLPHESLKYDRTIVKSS